MAQRKKKEDEKIRALEDEEVERRKVDAKEEAFQMEIRNDMITRANKILHDNQDKVKSLHQKMMMSDVLQERDAQKKLGQRKKKQVKAMEQNWFNEEQVRMSEHDEK